MKDNGLPSKFDELRRRAEDVFSEREGGTTISSGMDILSLIQELEVHQIELQMQMEELQQARRESDESQRKYAELYHHAPMGYVDLTKDGLISKSNVAAARILGISGNSQTNTPFFAFIHPEDQGKFRALLNRVAKGEHEGGTCEIRTARKKENDEPYFIQAEISISMDTERKVNGWRVAFVDITERKQMEEELRAARDHLEQRVKERTAELERSNKELQDFAFIVSHDLQEPLRKILTFSNMVMKGTENVVNETSSDYLKRVHGAATRMQELLRALLGYSRVETKSKVFGECNLNKTVEDVVSDLELLVQRTGGSVEISDLPVIHADTAQIRQLFQNLITNALKFHKEATPPMVKVYTLSGDPDNYSIAVEDNGIGFDEQFIEKIFAPFQRLHGMSSQYRGTGMGLAICRKIVARHGGSISAKSIPGKGSTFIIRLPRKQNV